MPIQSRSRLSWRRLLMTLFVLSAAALACNFADRTAVDLPLAETDPVDANPPPADPAGADRDEAEPDADLPDQPPAAGADEPLDVQPKVLEVVNATDGPICEISVTSTYDEFWGDNLLSEDLQPGASFTYDEFDPELYDFIPNDCADNVVEEWYEIPLGEHRIIWNIGGELVAGQGPGPQAPQVPIDYTPQFVETDCMIPLPGDIPARCGYLQVPENRSVPGSSTIEIAVVILEPLSGEALPDPVIHLEGGPGGSALDFLADSPYSLADDPVLGTYTQIFVDQRGTGYSRPSLNCPELEADYTFEAEFACYDRLVGEGIDLSAYNSLENAADIADLITALGYDQVNLYGVSYGTRLGLTVMREHPENIRSVILDSVYPPDIRSPLEEGTAAWGAITNILDDCAADPECAAAYPDIEGQLVALIAELEANPLDVTLTDYDFDETFQTTIDGFDFIDTLVSAFYAAEVSAQYLPRAIVDLRNGDEAAYDALRYGLFEFGFATNFARPTQSESDDYSDSEGMFNSVSCREEYAYYFSFEARQYLDDLVPAEVLDPLMWGIEDFFYTCYYWDVGEAPAIEETAVNSDIPALLIGGGYDPVTPGAWAERAAETLTNGYAYVFPYHGHSITSFVDCSWELMDQFLGNPAVAPDRSCVAALPPPDFVLPGEPIDLPE
ncbi:MAG: alpha/beta hydrolase [Chloroflexi bacterium]|nr:alpha/beta hydrolase [Chloroflexota bacterium]